MIHYSIFSIPKCLRNLIELKPFHIFLMYQSLYLDFVDTASHFPNEKGRSSVAARKNRPSLFSAFNRSPAAQQQHLGWTEWSTCSRPSNGLGHGNEPLLPTVSYLHWKLLLDRRDMKIWHHDLAEKEKIRERGGSEEAPFQEYIPFLWKFTIFVLFNGFKKYLLVKFSFLIPGILY